MSAAPGVFSQIVDGIGNGISNVASIPGRFIDNALWFSPPIMALMFVNFILFIVVLVMLLQRMTEGFAQSGESITMYYSPLCGACKVDLPLFGAMQRKYGGGIKFNMIDIYANDITGINSIPTYIYETNSGQKISKVGAYGSLEKMEAQIRSVFNIDEYERNLKSQ